jgi:hypothetical protein
MDIEERAIRVSHRAFTRVTCIGKRPDERGKGIATQLILVHFKDTFNEQEAKLGPAPHKWLSFAQPSTDGITNPIGFPFPSRRF